MELAKKMEKIKADIDVESSKIELEEEEEESEEENDQEEEKEINKLNEFELLKAKVRAKMPKKIAAKGIISNLRPIEEDSMDEMSLSAMKELPKSPPLDSKKNEEFKILTDDQKREHVIEMMKNPTL